VFSKFYEDLPAMQITHLNTATLTDMWFSNEPSLRMRANVPYWAQGAPETSTVAYTIMGPDTVVLPHKSNTEVLFLILEGSVEVQVGDERGVFSADDLLRIPVGVEYSVRNAGETARIVAFFASGETILTFRETVMPRGTQVFANMRNEWIFDESHE
jgi:mannose-6-phosphate isomerase-like protein (cupin superfamily)